MALHVGTQRRLRASVRLHTLEKLSEHASPNIYPEVRIADEVNVLNAVFTSRQVRTHDRNA